jgi:predicted ribosome quality control (RQC) complex YloA/Tae2 family protein
MRNELSSLDLKFLANELKVLVGGIIQKAWQEGRQLRFEIFLPSKGTFELLMEPGKVFITEYRRKAPESPEAFAMALRKHLAGQRIIGIRQPGFERILEIATERTVLVLELFSKGNAIICDKTGTIIVPLEVQFWRSRKIASRVKYAYPPQVADPYSLTVEQLYALFQSTEKDLVRFLAADLSFSGLYAEEICARAEMPKNKLCKALSTDETKRIFEIFHGLLTNIQPCIVFDGEVAVDAVPIKMKLYEGKRCEPFSNFTSALDEYFTHRENVAVELGKKAVYQAETGKVERIQAEQKLALTNWKKKERDSRKKAEAIYRNFQTVEKIIAGLNKAKESGMSWDEIKKKVKSEKTAEAKAIKEIREKEGKVILRLK